MFDENDEERKKREEEAKNIISSLNPQNSNGSAINFVNYSNDNNYKINVNSEEEQSYINKINEANSIINSINSRKEGSIPEPTEEEREVSRRNAQELLNLMDNNTQNIQGEQQVANSSVEEVQADRTSLSNGNNKNAAVDIIMNKKPAYETKQTNQNNEQTQYSSKDNAETNEDTNIFTSIKNIFENLLLGGASGVKQVLKYIETSNEQNFSNYKQLREKQYKTSPNTAIDKVTNQETNLIKKGLQDSIDQDTLKAQENINNTTGTITRKLAELAPSIGQMTVGWGASAINPMLGISYFMTSAGGSYIDDAKDRGMNDEQAFTYGTIMGAMEGATEEIGISKLMKGGKALSKGVVKEALKNYGLNAADNFIQEAIIEPISEATATIVGGKETADWDDITGRMLQAGFDGALSALIMDGASAGINSSIRVVDKIRNNENISQTDIKKAIQDINDNENINVEDTIKSEINYQVQESSNTDSYMLTRYNNENDNIELYDVKGESININNNELNINPAIVKMEGFYNVIDANSGLELYTTVSTNKQDTINEFKEKINNLDQAGIQNVNNQVAQTKIAIANKLQEIENNPQAIQDFKVQNQNITDTNSSNISTQNNTQEISNPKVRDLRTAISQIQDSSYYNSNRANEIMKTVSDNFDNVTYTPKGKSSTLTIKNDNGHTMYSKDIRNNIGYSGKSIKNILSNVYNYVMDNENTNSNNAQTSPEQNTGNNSSNATNYAVQDINKVTEPFSNQESYTRDEMAEVWNNEISNNNYDAYYDDNGNIERYIAIEEDGNNIVVNQYDNNNNVVKSEVIPNENGKYNNEDIRDTILKVSSNIDLSPYIQEMAYNFQDDLANTLPGERYKAGDTWTGQKRATTRELADIKDETGASWNKIGEVLEDIANGRKNKTKLARTIEQKLDEALSKGYTNIYGKTIMPNEEYLQQKSKVYSRDFNTQINEDYDPIEYMTDEDFRIFGMKKSNNNSKSKSNEVKSIKKKETNSKNNIQNDGIENFSNQVDAVLDGTFPKNSMLTLLKETPKPLQDIGLPNLPITMTQRHLKTIINETGTDTSANYHGLGIETVKQLPEAISTPLDIVKSNTRNDSVVLTTYLSDKQDRTIIASIKINGKGTINDIRIDTNVMTSAYGRNNYEKFMEENLKNGNLLYDIDRGVIKKVTGARLQLPGSSNSTTKTNGSISTNSISQNTSNVKKNTATNKSMQNNRNNTSNGTRSMKQNTNKVTDSEGRTLTKQQQEYFKDSKVRDENGNLLVMYHGTDRAFTEFKNKYIQHGRAVTDGFYLTPDRTNASEYGNNIMELYANIKNPLYLHNYNGVTRELIDRGYANDTDGLIKKYNLETDNSGVVPTAKALTKLVKKLGYDGIITTTNENDIIDTDWSATQIVVFNSNQIKNITNSSPTSDKDIRYMKRNTLRSKTSPNNITVDNQGRTLSKQQQEYFKNSKVRDDNGNLQTVYHTSKESFTIFNPVGTEHYRFGENSVNYFTDNKVMSLSYEKETPNLYEGYLNITNPYVIDAKGAEWNKVSKSIDKTLLNKISNISTDLKQEIINKAKETNNKKVELWDNYQNEVDKIYSLKKELTQPGEYISIDELENNINNKQPSQRTVDEKEYLRLRKKSEQLYSDYNEYDGKSEFYNYFENNNEFDNIINSLTYKQKNNVKTVSRDEFYEIAKLGFDPQNIADRFEYFETTNDIVFKVLDENKTRKQKYDGVIIKNVLDYADYSNYDGTGNIFVVFNSNQFKNADNTKPTSNQDIRFAKKTVKPVDETFEPGQTNAQRESNYIEQEIKKIEQIGNWDDSIPVTKMTDIRKTIEDYLGIGVQKGHFRQQAYGIYKGNRDVIRTKELKDIDTILHETGHALDIGNRIKINKESISNELLKAVDNYGGYEAETREIQLEEGFAEVIREYTIVPEQAKVDYPQTVTVLEGIRQENKDFDNFIRTVQEQSYNYIHQNPRNRTLSNVSIGEQTDKRVWTKASTTEAIMRAIYDKDWSLKSAVNELQKVQGKSIQDLKASENAYYLTRLSSGIGGKITSMLSNGYIDETGNKLMPGLNQLGEILGDNPQRFDDLRAYLVAQRDLEYKAKTLKTGIRTMDSKAVVEQFKNDTQIQEASKLIYDTLDGVMQYAVNNGLITQENADSLRESNVFYVPMQRVLEGNKNNVGRRGAVVDVIKARTGSELDVKDVLENIVSNSANIIQQVENNNVLKALYKQGEQSGITGKIYDVISTPMVKVGTAKLSTWESELKNQGVDITDIDFDKTIDLFAPNNKIDSKNLITSFINDNGKRVYLQFNDDVLFNSLMNMDRKFMSTVLNINRKFNMPLRYGATMANIGFAIPNVISDTAQAAIFSDAGFIPVVDNLIGVMDIISAQNKGARDFFNKIIPGYADRINTLYALYEQSGATSSTRMSQYRESTQVLMKDVYGTKNSEVLGIKEKYKPLKRLLDIMTYIPDISEQSTRFRVFEKNLEYYRRNGMEETDARIQAALQSRDATQDFGRTGNVTREINQLIPFSAARVGSAYTFAEKVKANPKRTAMRLSILTAVAMAIKAIGYDDDEIEELNQRKKNDNFVLKIGDEIVTIKKPQGILRSIVNFTEYIQDLFTKHIEEGKEGERLTELVQSAIMDNMPADSVTGLVPNMVAPVIENAINKDLYYNSDIVKSYDLELPDSEQYYDYNSQLAIWLGQVFNYSPAKIDNLISGYFAGLGTSVTNVIDWIAGKTGITAEQPEMGAEDNAVAKRFIVNVNSNSASADEVYNLKTELTKKKNGGTITSEESQQLEDVTNATSEMAKLNKQIKEIKKDLTMSGEEKAEQIKLLQQQKVDTARKSLGKEVLYSENETNIESTTFYPSRDTLSQNGYSLNLTSDMKKEYEELAYNKYKEYENQGLYSEEKLEKIREKCKDYAKSQLLKKYKNDLIKKSK